MVPHTIPIPNPSLDDHIRKASENLLLLLTSKKEKPIGPYVNSSTKEAILKLAHILHQDKSGKTPLLVTYEVGVKDKGKRTTSGNIKTGPEKSSIL